MVFVAERRMRWGGVIGCGGRDMSRNAWQQVIMTEGGGDYQ